MEENGQDQMKYLMRMVIYQQLLSAMVLFSVEILGKLLLHQKLFRKNFLKDKTYKEKKGYQINFPKYFLIAKI